MIISNTVFGQTHNKIESALSYVYAEFVQTCRRTIIILESMNLVDQIKVNLSCAIQCITMEVYQIYYRHVLCYRTDLGGMISIDCRCMYSKTCIERPKKQILRSNLEYFILSKFKCQLCCMSQIDAQFLIYKCNLFLNLSKNQEVQYIKTFHEIYAILIHSSCGLVLLLACRKIENT